ncbi:MAG TPA: Ppx/GppA phosphatase family protein [Phycisphaerae bacterium]|nr:Ppx/GppA phosphatase family protein [Phycisphaerae bacterium]
MEAPRSESGGSVAAFLDVGTYSIRLLLVRFNPNQSYTVLSELKEPVRLGGGEFTNYLLQAQAMDRAVLICSRFATMARNNGAGDIIAVATSATREAENQTEFLRRLREEAGLEVRVISGREEARLIYLGISRGIHLNGKTGLFLDIGGGSTEVSVGDSRDFKYLDSLKLGAIRLTQMFQLDDPTKPIPKSLYASVCNYVRNAAVRAIQQVKQNPFDAAIGTAGTIRNLAGMASLRAGREVINGEPTITPGELSDVVSLLRSAPLPDRKRIPGLNPDRADVILAGAAILEVLMDELRIKRIAASRLGLRDGLLVNYLVRSRQHSDPVYELSARRRSILLLGRRCNFDERHAQAVARLTLDLFDSAKQLGLHDFGEAERELLEYAAILHDIGVFLCFVNHQAHSYYLIRHADLVGFDQMEIATIAALARYHRKGRPRPEHPEFAELDKKSQAIVSRLFVLLRLAERLERSHHGVVQQARFQKKGADTIGLGVKAEDDCSLELMAAEKDQKAFARAFDRQLVIARD